MGCGQPSKTHYITYNFLYLQPETDNNKKLKVTLRAQETLKIIENFSLVKFIYACARKNDLFKELIQNGNTLKNCIFFFNRKNSQLKTSHDYKFIFSYIPSRCIDINTIEDRYCIESLYILYTKISHMDIPRDYILNKIEKDSPIIGKIIDISACKSSILVSEEVIISSIAPYKEIIEDNGIDEAEIKGIAIEVHEELDKTSLDQILAMFNSNDRSNSTTKSLIPSIAPITSISIKNNKFQQMGLFNELFDALINCKTLKSVTISNNIVPTGFEKGCELITKLFKQNKNIRNINLSNNFIYTKYFIHILKEGLAGSVIYKLDFSSNFITYQGSQKLAEWLKYHRTLRVLNLQFNSTNDFKKEGSELILEELKLPINFLSLDLSHMVLTGFGQKMANFINSCFSLRELKIQNISMNSDDIKEIANAISDSTSISYLNISENSKSIDDESLKHISSMIEKNKSIKTIDLDKMNLTSKNFDSCLKIAFERNLYLEDLSFNGNSELLFGNLYEVFVNKKKIKHLSFKSVPIKDEDQINYVKRFRELRNDVVIQIDNI